MAKASIKPEDTNSLMALLNQIEKEPKAEPFKDPVDWKALDLQDYPKIVKRPIDLSTIKDSLNNNRYETYDQFFGDIQLIWDNCKSYNIAESEIYRMAEDLESTSKKLINKLKTRLGLNTSAAKKRSPDQEMVKSDEDEDEDDDDDADVSFDERIKFTDNVRKLKIEEMTTLVRMIQEKCPNVLDDLDSEKLQIKVDDIDKKLFEEFMAFTRECLDNNKPKPQDIEENSKSAEDDHEARKSEHTPPRQSRHDEGDEESKGDHSIDTSKYGPEGKRVKTS